MTENQPGTWSKELMPDRDSASGYSMQNVFTPSPSSPTTAVGLADFARRCQAYLDDAPLDGRHSDAAGANAYELIQEAIEHCIPAAPEAPGDVAEIDDAELVQRLQNYIPGENDDWVPLRMAQAAKAISRLSAETAVALTRAEQAEVWMGNAVTAQEAAEARLAEAEKVIQFAHDGYGNHDVNHIDYRMKVYQACLDYLEKHPRSGAVG